MNCFMSRLGISNFGQRRWHGLRNLTAAAVRASFQRPIRQLDDVKNRYTFVGVCCIMLRTLCGQSVHGSGTGYGWQRRKDPGAQRRSYRGMNHPVKSKAGYMVRLGLERRRDTVPFNVNVASRSIIKSRHAPIEIISRLRSFTEGASSTTILLSQRTVNWNGASKKYRVLLCRHNSITAIDPQPKRKCFSVTAVNGRKILYGWVPC